MKFNILLLIFPLFLLFGLSNCSKECEPVISTCSEITPPSDTTCHANFTRWFYIKDENTCKQITYTGCSKLGFETQKECKECECK